MSDPKPRTRDAAEDLEEVADEIDETREKGRN
jgi:hypothetical protein